MSAPTRAVVEDELYGTLAESRGISSGEIRASVGAEGAIDSLEGVELVAAAETRFGIKIADDELSPSVCRSVSRLADLVAAKLGVGS